MEITQVPIGDVRPHPRNARQGDVGAIVQSIRTNGVYRPLIVQRSTGYILAGNHTWRALGELDYETAPVCYVDADDDQALRILLVDNRASDLGTYDDGALTEMLVELATATEKALAGTGYDAQDLERMIADLSAPLDLSAIGRAWDRATPPEITENEPPADETIDRKVLVPEHPVTRPGDVWLLGPHRLLCGDCRDADDVERLLAGATVNLAITSPPYAEQRTYDEASGFRPIPPDEYVEWFRPVQENVARHLAIDGSWFVNIKAASDGLDRLLYVMDLVIAHAREWGWHFAEEFCWERNGVPKAVVSRLKNQFEPIYQFTRAAWKFRPESVMHPTDAAIIPRGPGAGSTSWADADSTVVSQGQRGDLFAGQRARRGAGDGGLKELQGQGRGAIPSARPGRGDTSWASRHGAGFDNGAVPLEGAYLGPGMAYPGNRLPTFSGSHEATGHGAAFPVGLPEFFVRLCTDEGDAVYDPFVGSGSTLLAAHRQDRVGYGMEISPAYCDVVAHRFQRHIGIVPVLEQTGAAHDFIGA